MNREKEWVHVNLIFKQYTLKLKNIRKVFKKPIDNNELK